MRPIRELRPAPPDGPTQVHPTLAEALRYLDVLRRHHLDLVSRFLAVDDGKLFTIDLFLTGVAMRSYHLVDGFLALLDEWNLIAAAPILRLQLDNLVRISYVVHAERSDVVAEAILEGREFRHMKAPDGERLLDRKLVRLAAEHHPWVPPVYDATSGWVHLSPVHALMPWSANTSDDETTALEGRFPLQPEQIPLSLLEELLGAMTKATEELFGYFEAWESRKGLPLGTARTRVATETPEEPPT